MKDLAWAPAVEHYLGASTFSTFCVDNSHDAKVLNTIMREIYLNERTPQIICSKFYNTVRKLIRSLRPNVYMVYVYRINLYTYIF